MPVLPEVDSTIVFLPGSMRPSASAASIIATPILSLTLPPGLCASSLPISSAPKSGATRPSLTSGVLPIRSARLSGMARVGGETLIRRRGYSPVCLRQDASGTGDAGVGFGADATTCLGLDRQSIRSKESSHGHHWCHGQHTLRPRRNPHGRAQSRDQG